MAANPESKEALLEGQPPAPPPEENKGAEEVKKEEVKQEEAKKEEVKQEEAKKEEVKQEEAKKEEVKQEEAKKEEPAPAAEAKKEEAPLLEERKAPPQSQGYMPKIHEDKTVIVQQFKNISVISIFLVCERVFAFFIMYLIFNQKRETPLPDNEKTLPWQLLVRMLILDIIIPVLFAIYIYLFYTRTKAVGKFQSLLKITYGYMGIVIATAILHIILLLSVSDSQYMFSIIVSMFSVVTEGFNLLLLGLYTRLSKTKIQENAISELEKAEDEEEYLRKMNV